jgi:hypothetical protein
MSICDLQFDEMRHRVNHVLELFGNKLLSFANIDSTSWSIKSALSYSSSVLTSDSGFPGTTGFHVSLWEQHLVRSMLPEC